MSRDRTEKVYIPLLYSPKFDSEAKKPDKLQWILASEFRMSQYFIGDYNFYHPSNIGHTGVDFATPEGTELFCPADGEVRWVDIDPDGYGNYIRIFHPKFKFHSFFAHLRELPNFQRGDVIQKGWVVGFTGNSGWSTGPHLHYEVRLAKSTGEYLGTDYNPKGVVDPILFYRRVNDV